MTSEFGVFQYKWLKSIEMDDGFCVAVIISDRHVLTAKDCIAGQQIRLLQIMYDDLSEDIHIKRTIQLNSKASNVAVLKLATPLVFDKFTGPICLPDSEARPNLKIIPDSWDVLKEINASAKMSSIKGFNVNSNTHITVTKGDNSGCPHSGESSTQLYSQRDKFSSWFTVGVLNTQDSHKVCRDTNAILVIKEERFEKQQSLSV